jgi:uncharacterized protein (DUF4415 family)
LLFTQSAAENIGLSRQGLPIKRKGRFIMLKIKDILRKKGVTAEMLTLANEAAKRNPDDQDPECLTPTREMWKKATRRGRPLKADRKQDVHIMFDVDVLSHLRSTGRGWQTRVNNYIRTAVHKGAL